MQESKASRLFLISSVVLGLLAAVVSFAYLDTASGTDRRPKAKILVAKHDIRENTPLDPEKDLEEMEIPAGATSLLARGLRPELAATYKGQRVNRPILASTPVMLADLMAGTDLELTGTNRALSLPVKGAQALSGLLIPGDMVKLMVTRPAFRIAAAGATAQAGQQTQWETLEVLPKALKVLAVGSRLSRSRQQISLADQLQVPSQPEAQQTVTLEVTEAEAKTILEQTGGGTLPVTLILCPPGTDAAGK
jgi:Flp pilus assembly protein CpaB